MDSDPNRPLLQKSQTKLCHVLKLSLKTESPISHLDSFDGDNSVMGGSSHGSSSIQTNSDSKAKSFDNLKNLKGSYGLKRSSLGYFPIVDSNPSLPPLESKALAPMTNGRSTKSQRTKSAAKNGSRNSKDNPNDSNLNDCDAYETTPSEIIDVGVETNDPAISTDGPRKSTNSSRFFKETSHQAKAPSTHDNAPQLDYHFKLISVAFKEAALDSPSFRASTNHLDSQLASTEKWLQAISALLSKITKQATELESWCLYLEYLVPSFLQDGIVDQEYTLTALEGTRDGLQQFWLIVQSALHIDMRSIESLEKNVVTRMSKYKNLRQKFHRHQRKYDHFLAIHMGMLKGKGPALLLEDLQQLAVVRNEYLKISLELVIEISEISQFINRLLIVFLNKIWLEKLEKLGDNPFALAIFSDVTEKIKRISCWSDIQHSSGQKMSQDVLRAMRNIQEHSIALLAPSKNLDDYKCDHINSRLLEDINETSTEKHGYLFMKTYTDKSKQPTWVRRWAFIQGGVLSFFVLDHSLTSVQETDKIGILLCNVKYSPNEDRSFCFEVKTIDSTLVLQAETLKELKSWLKVFSNVGSRIVDENDPMHSLLKVASGRYPPLVLEFQSTANTSTDKKLTHTKILSSSGQIITSSKLSSHLEKNEAFFQKYIYNQIGRIFLPFVTETTRSALVAYSLTGSTVVPSALSANIWGSINWGLYYLYEPTVAPEKGSEGSEACSSIKMPKEFPHEWAARDVQLKAIFETAVEPGEFCLFSYHCLLSPSANQSLRATHFVTQMHIYSYIQSLGFISLSKLQLCRIVEATVTHLQDHDILKLFLILGLLKLKLFLDDGRLVQQKLELLLRNSCSDMPLGISEIIRQLVAIEDAHNEKKIEEKFHIFTVPEKRSLSTSLEIVSPENSPPSNLIGFPDAMPYFMEKNFNISPQALLHSLFGSKSHVFMDLYQFMNVRLSETIAWLKSSNPNHYLEREIELDVLFFNGKPGRMVINQVIEKFVENEYYSIKVKNSSFKMKYGPLFDYTMRFIIEQVDGGRSRIKFYGSTNVEGSFIAQFAPRYLGGTIIPIFFNELSRKLKEASIQLGARGKIARATHIYGRILVTENAMIKKTSAPVIIDNRVVCNWCFQIKVRQITGGLKRIILGCFAILMKFLKTLSVHWLLIGIIICLTLSNVFLGARSAAHYWKTRQVSNMVAEILDVDTMNINRAIYSKDVQDFANMGVAAFSDGACFQVFKNQSVVFNPDKLYEWRSELEFEPEDRIRNYKRRVQEIAQRRNELLLTLSTLNKMEEEVAINEWTSWIFSESRRCQNMHDAGFFSDKNQHVSRPILEKLENYCRSCENELSHRSKR